MHEQEILTASGIALAKAIKEGRCSSKQVVEQHIAHIRRVNPSLNAMVADRFKAAIAEAEAADRAIERGNPDNLPLYHGVPCSIKESFALSGMPQTAGLPARNGYIADSDAITVKRYREAGLIPLGVTNISELCMWMESDNRVYGRTNNPYDLNCIVGGSSGGEGAIIGAGGAPIGLGSDIGGSIRMPAFFNGIFGHKPSSGLVPGSGQFPLAHERAATYLGTGPMCRRAEDLWPLLNILAGPDGRDEACRSFSLGDPAEVDMSSLLVLNIPDNGRITVRKELQAAQIEAALALQQCGAQVEHIKIDELKYSLEIWSALMSTAGGPAFGVLLGNGKPVNSALELVKWTFGISDHTLPAIGLAAIESLLKLAPRQIDKMSKLGEKLKHRLDTLLDSRTVILYPSYPEPSPPHHKPLFPPYRWMYTAIFNVMRLPVTQVPLGLDKNNHPLGVQVVAGDGNDHLSIAVALQLEKECGGWIPPRFTEASSA